MGSLTGSGVTITGTTLQDGNELGGTYTLEYAGSVTSSIPYSATADELDAALTSLVGAVSVTRSSTTTEGGSTYTVTFTGLTGDVSELVPYYSSTLTGTNAVVKVNTATQGSLSTGTQLKVSFDAPMHCSHSQVPSGECGNAVSAYSLEIGTSSANHNIILPLTPNYDVQYVRVASLDLQNYAIYDGKTASGTFQISYNGATTGAIHAAASATDLREAVENLPDINTVHVTRDYAGEELPYKVSVDVGDLTLSCADGYACDFTLPAGELIKVGGMWYKVLYSHDFTTSSTTLPLAEVTDSTLSASFSGIASTSASLYRWTRGYEWAVTFLSTVDGTVSALSSPKHALLPSSSTVSIRASDCVSCAYITSLSVWTNYFLAVRAQNEYGYGSYSTTTGVPKEVPGAPTYVSSSAVSGTEMEVFFSPPTGDTSDVTQYTVEWDNNDDFTNLDDSSLSPSCSTTGYGRCQITGSSLDGIPPYSYLIQYLTSGNAYYVRVAARNSISISAGMTDENTYWSTSVTSTTADQAPSAPVSVVTQLAGPSQIQTLITTPLSNGGASITDYYIEWCASSAFDDASTYASTTQTASSLDELTTGVLVYEITSLTASNSYWVRASAINSIGNGSTTMASSAVLVGAKSGAPATVSLSTATDQDTPITEETLTWTAPSSNGGSAISGYLVEFWEDGYTPEVQVVTFESTEYYQTDSVGAYTYSGSYREFKLTYAPTTSLKEDSSEMPASVHPYNVRSSLMNMGRASSYASNDVIGNVEVSKTTLANSGYQWSITFLDSINRGDLVPLQISLSGDDSSVSTSVTTLVDGRREFGNREEQIIEVLSQGSTSLSDLDGYFTLSFNGTETRTAYLSVDATDAEVERALEQLPSLRDVSVTRSTTTSATCNSVTCSGYLWTVTFTDKGNQPAIAIDTTYVTSTSTAVVASVYDGDNSLSTAGYKASAAVPGEYAVGYNSRTVSADTLTYTITGLVPGSNYYASVSAINAYGISTATIPSTSYVTPPKQIPEPPTNVALSVHSGSATTLDVTYDAPTSNGGADILNYRIELDTGSDFSNPIYSQAYCSPANTHSVFQITTAELADEVGVESKIVGVTATYANSTTFTTSDIDELIFVGDRLRFRYSNGTVATEYDAQYFTVTGISTTGSVSTVTILGSTGVLGSVDDFGTTTPFSSDIYRLIGGRGSGSDSFIGCYDETDPGIYSSATHTTYWSETLDTYCDPSQGRTWTGISTEYTRSQTSGSVQTKFQLIADALTLGVDVDRDDPDNLNGVTWRVTFLDNSPDGALNFDVTTATTSLVTASGAW